MVVQVELKDFQRTYIDNIRLHGTGFRGEKVLGTGRCRRSYEDRLNNYNIVRERIFNEDVKMVKLDKIRRTRKRFKNKRKECGEIKASVRICECVSNQEEKDKRAFAEIKLGNIRIEGLLDSGASVSILGENSEEIIDGLNLKVDPVFVSLRTAGGKEYNVLGKIRVPVEFKGRIEMIQFYICPNLLQRAYLGVDFWRAFNLAPEIFGTEEINVDKLSENFPLDTDKVQQHELNDLEKKNWRRQKQSFEHSRKTD